MTKNGAKIVAGLRALSYKPDVVISGTVVSGSYDAASNTISILPIGGEMQIEKVMLHAVSGEDSGLLLVPKNGSNVIAGCVDGDGAWCVLKTAELEKAVIRTGDTIVTIDAAGLKASRNGAGIEMGALTKICSPSEDLRALLADLLVAIKAITVTTSTGPSSVPVNIASFIALEVRLNNLLTS